MKSIMSFRSMLHNIGQDYAFNESIEYAVDFICCLKVLNIISHDSYSNFSEYAYLTELSEHYREL